jgi:hypothetical protein
MIYKQSAQSGVPPLPSIGEGRFGWKFKAGGPDPTRSRVWFVDGLLGSDQYDGADPETAFATVGKAISMAVAYDVIYVLDMGYDVSGGDPVPYTAVTTNLSIAVGKNNLALVGVPHNIHQVYGLQLKPVSASTTPILSVYAPLVSIENLCFNKRGDGVGSCVYIIEDGTYGGTGVSLYNCHFRNADMGSAAHTTNAGVKLIGTKWADISRCYFFDCRNGVAQGSGTNTINFTTIRDCVFSASVVANIDVDILLIPGSSGQSAGHLVDNCRFVHDVPAFAGAGALTAYIYDLLSTDFLVSECHFATDNATCKDTVTNEIVTLAGNTIVGCYDAAGLVAWA